MAAKATVMDGAVLKSGCVIGAAAVVDSQETVQDGIYVSDRAKLAKTRGEPRLMEWLTCFANRRR